MYDNLKLKKVCVKPLDGNKTISNGNSYENRQTVFETRFSVEENVISQASLSFFWNRAQRLPCQRALCSCMQKSFALISIEPDYASYNSIKNTEKFVYHSWNIRENLKNETNCWENAFKPCEESVFTCSTSSSSLFVLYLSTAHRCVLSKMNVSYLRSIIIRRYWNKKKGIHFHFFTKIPVSSRRATHISNKKYINLGKMLSSMQASIQYLSTNWDYRLLLRTQKIHWQTSILPIFQQHHVIKQP